MFTALLFTPEKVNGFTPPAVHFRFILSFLIALKRKQKFILSEIKDTKVRFMSDTNLKMKAMKRERLIAVILVFSMLGFTACQKETTSVTQKGPSSLQIKIQTLNKSYSLPVSETKSAMGGTSMITWDSAQMVVSNVKFDAELKSMVTHRDSIEISYKWTGPVVTDLMDTSISFGNFVLQPGFYDQVEIKVNGNHHDAGDQPVFYMHGMYSKDTTTIPVMVKVFEDVSFKTEKDSVDVTDEAVDFTSYIQLYLDQLMAGVDPSAFDNATLTDGMIVISAEKNRDLYRIFMHNLGHDHHSYFHFWNDFGHHEKNNNHGEHD